MEAVRRGAQEESGVALLERTAAAEHGDHRRECCRSDTSLWLVQIEERMEAARAAEHAAEPNEMLRAQGAHRRRLREDLPHIRLDRRTLRGRRKEPRHMGAPQRERAERQTPPLLHRAPRKGDDLRAAAANVRHDAVRIGNARRRPAKGVHRLLRAREHADADACAPLDLREHRSAVRRRAQRRRREGMDAADAEGVDEIHESTENLYRQVNALAREPPIGEAARKSRRVLALHEHRKRIALDLIDRHADGVRADVDDRMQHRATS